jgi:ELMO/CED-12 family/FYVE zinc finger
MYMQTRLYCNYAMFRTRSLGPLFGVTLSRVLFFVVTKHTLKFVLSNSLLLLPPPTSTTTTTTTAAAAFLDEVRALDKNDEIQVPQWMPDDAVTQCTGCGIQFSLLVRRHHCRACGLILCDDCSSSRVPLPQFGYADHVRVCNSCLCEFAANIRGLDAKELISFATSFDPVFLAQVDELKETMGSLATEIGGVERAIFNAGEQSGQDDKLNDLVTSMNKIASQSADIQDGITGLRLEHGIVVPIVTSREDASLTPLFRLASEQLVRDHTKLVQAARRCASDLGTIGDERKAHMLRKNQSVKTQPYTQAPPSRGRSDGRSDDVVSPVASLPSTIASLLASPQDDPFDYDELAGLGQTENGSPIMHMMSPDVQLERPSTAPVAGKHGSNFAALESDSDSDDYDSNAGSPPPPTSTQSSPRVLECMRTRPIISAPSRPRSSSVAVRSSSSNLETSMSSIGAAVSSTDGGDLMTRTDSNGMSPTATDASLFNISRSVIRPSLAITSEIDPAADMDNDHPHNRLRLLVITPAGVVGVTTVLRRGPPSRHHRHARDAGYEFRFELIVRVDEIQSSNVYVPTHGEFEGIPAMKVKVRYNWCFAEQATDTTDTIELALLSEVAETLRSRAAALASSTSPATGANNMNRRRSRSLSISVSSLVTRRAALAAAAASLDENGSSSGDDAKHCLTQSPSAFFEQSLQELVSYNDIVETVSAFRDRCSKLRRELAKNLQTLAAYMRTPVTWENAMHEKLLQQVWSGFQPGVPYPGRHGEAWKNLGFQGCDPTTDFRGMGELGLRCVVYLAEHHAQLVQHMLARQPELVDRHYPLCVAVIHCVSVVASELGFGRSRRVLLDINRLYIAPLFRAMLMSHTDNVFEELVRVLITVTDVIWHRTQATYFDFPAVLETIKSRLQYATTICHPISFSELLQHVAIDDDVLPM